MATKRDYIRMGMLMVEAHGIALRQSGIYGASKIKALLDTALDLARQSVKAIDADIDRERATEEGMAAGT